MIASALQHRVLALANQVGLRNDLDGVPARLLRHTVCERRVALAHRAENPTLCLVLEGRKSVRHGDQREIIRPGQLLLLPARFRVDVEEEPCAESGAYRAVHVEFSQALIERFRNTWPETPERLPGSASLRVEVDTSFAEALGHALEALLQPEHHGRVAAEGRLMQVLLRLRRQGRLPDLVGLCEEDTGAQVRELIRLNPAEEWTAERLAPLLGTSAATLDEQLRAAGGLARIVEEERMNRALELLGSAETSLSDVAWACGYESPDRFEIRFRAHHGENAAALLRRPAAS